jgi:rhodanese-related sulfurtransferase
VAAIDVKGTSRVRSIDRNELRNKLDRKTGVHIFNVLSKEFYDPEKMIPGSEWFPVDQLEQLVKDARIGKDEEIVTYCAGQGCTASHDAAEKLVALGFTKVSRYEGGLEDWARAGLAFEKGRAPTAA